MSTPLSLLVLTGVSILFWLQARTLIRELKTGVPYLFFRPHPAYRGRPGNHRSPFLWFSVTFSLLEAVALALMGVVAVVFLLESLGDYQ